ncbi:YdcF family protein [Sulfuricystis multivorans]|uniref:YdcF family protein n=1 Tax=Sulfuricystis multivorans TaxID=2211108 RepID=UPI000F82E01D|nr:YdcF family protein [Sulfuricystis multivorans]
MDSLPTSFLLKKFVSALILPPGGFLLCILLGLLLMRRRPWLGRGLAWSGALLAWLSSTPACVDPLVALLEDVPVLQARDLARAEAIVILGAGAHRQMPEYGGGSAPNRLALERLRYGARLARASDLPVLLSGEAGPMADVLRNDFGVTPRWLEGASLDTQDNAAHTLKILERAGIRRIVLVTHAIHMRRALAEFALANSAIEVIPAPLGFLSRHGGDEPEPAFLAVLPGPSAAYSAWYAAHEWAGLLALKLRQRFF